VLEHLAPQCCALFGLVQQIQDPVTEGLDRNLGTFLFEKLEHLVVAIAFRLLCPELTDDFDHRSYSKPIHLNLGEGRHTIRQRRRETPAKQVVKHFARCISPTVSPGRTTTCDEGGDGPRKMLRELKRSAVAQMSCNLLCNRRDESIDLSRVRLIRSQSSMQVVEQISKNESVKRIHSEIDAELQPTMSRARADPMVLLEEQNPKPSKACLFKRRTKLGFIHPKTAWAIRARREKDIIADDLSAGHPCVFKATQKPNEAADSEVNRIAEPVTAVLLPDLVCVAVRSGEALALVPVVPEHRLNHQLMFPGEPPEQNGRVLTFGSTERQFDRAPKMAGYVP
jgi:hypothetical protein